MKRSEMLNIIEKSIYVSTKHKYSGIIATAILQSIEEAGMLPPDTSTMRDMVIEGQYFDVKKHLKWEPEDA